MWVGFFVLLLCLSSGEKDCLRRFLLNWLKMMLTFKFNRKGSSVLCMGKGWCVCRLSFEAHNWFHFSNVVIGLQTSFRCVSCSHAGLLRIRLKTSVTSVMSCYVSVTFPPKNFFKCGLINFLLWLRSELKWFLPTRHALAESGTTFLPQSLLADAIRVCYITLAFLGH